MLLHQLPWLLLSLFLFLFLFLSFSSTPALSQAQLHDFIYNGFKGLQPNNITLNGAAEITTAGILKLTDHTPRIIGRGFYPDKIRFKNHTTGKSLSFSTSFVFSIDQRLAGHGVAFTISPTKDLPGALPRQYLGLLNSTNNGNSSNHIFAVEFDTIQDFEFSDIDDNHVGINLNGMTSNESTPAGFFTDGNSSKQQLNLKNGKKIQAWIDYDAVKPQLNITLSLSSTKPSTPILSSPIDLSSVFQDFMYVGFSASTGLLASSHHIFGWTFNMSGQAQSLDLSNLPSLPEGEKNRRFIIGVSASVFLAFIIFVVGGGFLVMKKIKNMDVIEEWELDVGPHKYSYKELEEATKGFRDKELLGFGGFGRVYKGVLPNSKTLVAVKRISHESKQGIREFVTEISSIGRLRHRNLVQLLGWCRRRGDLLLVYDFMANGSLDKYIYDDPVLILSWEERFKIIKGVASGLLYLHEEWEQTVLHRDIKAGNVLLDSELNGRLGDFGLAKIYEHGSNPSTTRVVGTLGYLAPELTRTGKPTTHSDVFAFGALLLEVVCGRRPIETKALPEELILVDWVWDKLREGVILEVVDSRLKGEFDEVEALVVLKLGLMCSNNMPSARPTMRQVVSYLQGEVPLPEGLATPCEVSKTSGFGLEFDYVHSYHPSTYLEKMSNSSLGDAEGDVDLEAGLASPLSATAKEEQVIMI